MAVRIVAGRAGSGKSLRCYQRIVSAMREQPLGRPIFWVVPRQATFSAERWLTCGSGLPAYTRCRVVSFEGLAKEVLAATGMLAKPVMSRGGRQVVLAHLLRQNADKLQHFRPSARHPGLASEVLNLLDEFGRNGATDKLEGALAEIGPDNPTLQAKLADLVLLQKAYADYVGGGVFDKDSRMRHVLDHVGACPVFQGATVYVDGFLDLLDFERRMLVSLCETAADVEVTFCLDPASPLLEDFDPVPADESVFHKMETAHRALRIALRERQIPVEIVRLRGCSRGDSPMLRGVEEAFLETPPPSAHGNEKAAQPSSVRLIEASDVRGEVEAAAREIRKLVREEGGGYRYRDIVVLVRELGPYRAAVSSVFTEYGIRHFMDHRRDASCHPLLRMIRSVLAICVGGFSTTEVVSILKGGLVDGATAELASITENWAITKGLRGEAWTVTHRSEPPEIELVRAKLVGAIAGYSAAFASPQGLSARDACVRLLALIEGLGVRNVLARWVDEANKLGEPETVAEHLGVWSETMGFLDETADLLGDALVTAADFQQAVLSGLEGMDLGLTPPTVDSVLVGSAERTRPGDARVAIVLGLSDGSFPKAHAEQGLLSDRERRALRGLRTAALPIDADTDRKQIDELLIGYLALTRPAEQLIAIRPTTGPRGEPAAESPFWRLLRLATGTTIEPARRPEELDIWTPRGLVVSLVRWAREPDAHREPPFPVLYDYFVQAMARETGSKLETIGSAVWPALSRQNVARPLSQMVTAALYPQPLTLTDDQLETFAACPFKHFLSYGLRIGELKEPAVDGRRVSGMLHRILQRITDELAQDESNWDGLSPNAVDALIRQHAREAIDRELRALTYDGSADENKLTARDRHLLARVSRLVWEVVEGHRRSAGRTKFVPRGAGVRFGDDGKLPGLRLRLASGEVLVTGHIDRLDHSTDGTMTAAWDYSLRGRTVSLAKVYWGLTLRTVIHLLVLREAGEAPAGAFGTALVGGVRSLKSLEEWREAERADSDEYHLARRQGRGLYNVAAITDFDTGVARGDKPALVYARLTKEGQPYKNSTDALTPDQLRGLLDHVEKRIRQLAEQIIKGVVAVRPYQLGTSSACVGCDFAAACRFDPREPPSYLQLDNYKPDQLWEKLLDGTGVEV